MRFSFNPAASFADEIAEDNLRMIPGLTKHREESRKLAEFLALYEQDH